MTLANILSPPLPPPSAEDAERAVLAAMLADPVACDRALELLAASAFYRTAHARLFTVIEGLVRGEVAVDPITVRTALEQQGQLEAVGGVAFLGRLLDEFTTASGLDYFCGEVNAAAQWRQLIAVANSIIQEAHDGPQTADDLLELAESRVREVRRGRAGDTSFVRLKSILWTTLEAIDQRRLSAGGITGVPSGFAALDALTLGFQPGDLVVLAARPSMGKTALALNMATHAVLQHEIPTAVLSLEMSSDQLLMRALASEARVDSQRIRLGRLSADDDASLARAAAVLGTAPLWIDDTAGLTIFEVRRRARRLKAKSGLGFLIIDYLQLLDGVPGAENRQNEVAGISRALKMLAKELDIPVLVLSQLSRSVEQRMDKRPLLSDLRESGAIEQDADDVLFLYRPEYYEVAGPTYPDGSPKFVTGTSTPLAGHAELIVAKQRNGPTGSVALRFEKAITRFEDPTMVEHSHGRLRVMR